MSENDNEDLIIVILEDLGIGIPIGLVESGWLNEFGKRIEDFWRLYGFLRETKVEEVIKDEQSRELYRYLKEQEAEISSRITLTKGDAWILNFLKNVEGSDIVAFMKLAGPLFYIKNIANDIKTKNRELTNNIKAALFIYLFQGIYEVLISNIDSCLYVYLDKNTQIKGKAINEYREKVINKRKDERKRKADVGKHASGSMINKVIKEIYHEECKTKNIKEEQNLFDEDTLNSVTYTLRNPSALRNASAHFNMFYDDGINKIVFLNGKKMSIEEFVLLYERIFLFSYEWLHEYIESDTEDEFVIKLKNELTKMLNIAIDSMKRIERQGYHTHWESVIWNMWGAKLVKFRTEYKKSEALRLKSQ